MVCAKCEKKLASTSSSSSSQVGAVDMWKTAAERSASRVVGQNKLLGAKARYSPYAPGGSKAGGSSGGVLGKGGKGKEAQAAVGKCETCKVTVARAGAKFCQGCAYKSGLCALCGKQVLDVRGYKMSSK